MSMYEENFNSHPVHKSISNFDQALRDIESTSFDTGTSEHLSRLRHIHDTIYLIMEDMNPFVAPLYRLNELQTPIDEEIQLISQYKTTQDASLLTQANERAEKALSVAYGLSAPRFKDTPSTYSKILSDYQQRSNEILSRLSEEASQLKKKGDESIDQLSKKLDELKTKTQQSINELSAQKTRLDNSLNQFQQAFSEAEAARTQKNAELERERDEKFNDLVAKIQTQANEALKTKEKQFQDRITASDNQLDAYFKELEEQKKKAEELVFAIANTGMVGGYQRNANNQRRSSIIWQVITIASMIFMIYFAINTFNAIKDTENIKFVIFAARFLVIATIGILAAFGIRQVVKHDEKEKFYRGMELELSSIEPYLAGLDEREIQELKILLAKRYFGLQSFTKDSRGVEATADSQEQALELFAMLKPLIEELIKTHIPKA